MKIYKIGGASSVKQKFSINIFCHDKKGGDCEEDIDDFISKCTC